MRSARWALLVLLAACAAGNLWVTLARSTIPLALDGEVADIDLRFEKERGVDDVYLVTVNGRTIHVDTPIGRQLRTGDRLTKEAWSRWLDTPRGPLRLGLSRDFRQMLLVMPVVFLAGAWLLLRPRE